MSAPLTLTLADPEAGTTEPLTVRFAARPDGAVEVAWGTGSRELWLPAAVAELAEHLDFALWEQAFDADRVLSWVYPLPSQHATDPPVVELGAHCAAILDWVRATVG